MTTKDFYRVLDVEPNASQEEIKKQYRFLVQAWHPDRFSTPESKAKAEEKLKQINEAYSELSDPVKRAAYDRTQESARTASAPPPRPKPKIVLSTTTLNFGTMTKGDDKTKSFTVDNHGGMPEEIHIDWETKPIWGELVIEPDKDFTFPIKLTVEVKTGNVAAGSHTGRVVAIIDGISYGVSVSVTVVVPVPKPTPSPKPKPAPAPTPVYTAPTPSPSIPWGIIVVIAVIVPIIVMVVFANSGGGSRQNGQSNSGSQGTDPFSGGFGSISGQVDVRNVQTSIVTGDASTVYKSIDVHNGSNWPIRVIFMYWGNTDIPNLGGSPAGCYPPRNSVQLIEGPTISINSNSLTGQRANLTATYKCDGAYYLSIDTNVEYTPVCVVYYPVTQNSYAAVESDQSLSPLTTCGQ